MNYVEESRKNWRPKDDLPTDAQIQIGCLQRIAAALERLALPWEAIDREKRWRVEAEQAAAYLKRRLNAQKAATTRAKRTASR